MCTRATAIDSLAEIIVRVRRFIGYFSVGHNELVYEHRHHLEQRQLWTFGLWQSSSRRRISCVAFRPPHRGPPEPEAGNGSLTPAMAATSGNPSCEPLAPFGSNCFVVLHHRPLPLCCNSRHWQPNEVLHTTICSIVNVDYTSSSQAHMLENNCRFERNGVPLCASIDSGVHRYSRPSKCGAFCPRLTLLGLYLLVPPGTALDE